MSSTSQLADFHLRKWHKNLLVVTQNYKSDPTILTIDRNTEKLKSECGARSGACVATATTPMPRISTSHDSTDAETGFDQQTTSYIDPTHKPRMIATLRRHKSISPRPFHPIPTPNKPTTPPCTISGTEQPRSRHSQMNRNGAYPHSLN